MSQPTQATKPVQALPTGRNLSDDRIEEIRAKRKARGTLSNDPGMRLSVDESKKDPRWQYRWVLDREMRIQQMQSQDWEFAPELGDERDTGMGSRVERVVNDRTVASAEKGFLMRKPKEFYSEDRKRRFARLTDSERALEQGDVGSSEGLSDHAYIPKGGMKINNGAYKP